MVINLAHRDDARLGGIILSNARLFNKARVANDALLARRMHSTRGVGIIESPASTGFFDSPLASLQTPKAGEAMEEVERP